MAPDAMSAAQRLGATFDAGTMTELHAQLVGGDPLDFPGYQAKLDAQREKTGMLEAVVTAEGQIDGIRAVVCVLDCAFFMGSMGTAVGEKITLAVEHAQRNHLPLIIFSASGGAVRERQASPVTTDSPRISGFCGWWFSPAGSPGCPPPQCACTRASAG